MMIRALFLALFVLCSSVQAQLENLPEGTILQSRNIDERENDSPGYWNHLAITSKGVVVEAQEGYGVIRTSFDEFLSRPYSRIRAFEPVDPGVGVRAAVIADGLVGLRFARFSSAAPVDLPILMRVRGVNCDSVVRYAYRRSTGERVWRLNIPDRMPVLVNRGIVRPPVDIRGDSVCTQSLPRRSLLQLRVRL